MYLKFNKYYNTIKSSSYLLVSLDYSMEKKIYNSIKFLIFAIIISPGFVLSKRPYAIIKNILIR